MKGKVTTILLLLIFAGGLLVLNYPVISTVYNQLNQGEVLAVYDEDLEKMRHEELAEQRRQAQEYNEKLVSSGAVLQDAFSTEKEEDPEYMNLLSVNENGVMGSIEIPKIHVYLPIYHGTSSDVLRNGVGHMEGTSLPIGGESTHAVLTGHRGLPQAELFTDLDQIEEGDVFYIYILKETLAYEVREVEVVSPENVDSLAVQEGKDLVTLVTCTPYGINSHRILVHAERIPYEGEAVDTQKAVRQNLMDWLLQQKSVLLTIAIFVLLILYGIIRLLRRCSKRRKNQNR